MAFYISLWEQTALLLYALLVGVFLAALYDVFRISRVMLTGTGIGGKRTSSEKIEGLISRLKVRPGDQVCRILKLTRTVKNKAVILIIFIEDVLFFVVAAIVLTVFLFQANFGQSRLYIYLGAALGFVIYYNTVGRISAAVSGFAVSLVRLVLVFISYKIAKPLFSIIVKAISVPVDACVVRSVKTSCDREAAKLFLMAEKGFVKNTALDCGVLNRKKSERSADNETRHKAGNEENQFPGKNRDSDSNAFLHSGNYRLQNRIFKSKGTAGRHTGKN